MKDVLTLPVLDALMPDHDRTSCDNHRINNGMFTVDNGRVSPRCTKCALIELITGAVLPSEFADHEATLRIQIYTKPGD